MKVVIQNGAIRTLSRQQAEAIVALFPAPWMERIDSITLCQGDHHTLQVKHYPRASAVGVFWPSSAHPQPGAAEAVQELLVALAIVTERGHLPLKVSKSVRARAEQQVSALLMRCVEVLRGDGAGHRSVATGP